MAWILHLVRSEWIAENKTSRTISARRCSIEMYGYFASSTH